MTRENPTNGRQNTPIYEEEGAKNRRIPQEIFEIMVPALQIGGLAGISGTIVGGFGGVIRSRTPVLFALASGIQWFTLGTAFHASRNAVLRSWEADHITPQDRIKASTIAGATAGVAGGLLRGPRNILPGAIMFSLFGATGQYIYNYRDARPQPTKEETVKNSWLNSRWSPVKVLTDTEYDEMLQEKKLRLDAQIALIDENIAVLREEEKRMAEQPKESVKESVDSTLK